MNPYAQITNPRTGRKVSVSGEIGRNIVKNYLKTVGMVGGMQPGSDSWEIKPQEDVAVNPVVSEPTPEMPPATSQPSEPSPPVPTPVPSLENSVPPEEEKPVSTEDKVRNRLKSAKSEVSSAHSAELLDNLATFRNADGHAAWAKKISDKINVFPGGQALWKQMHPEEKCLLVSKSIASDGDCSNLDDIFADLRSNAASYIVGAHLVSVQWETQVGNVKKEKDILAKLLQEANASGTLKDEMNKLVHDKSLKETELPWGKVFVQKNILNAAVKATNQLADFIENLIKKAEHILAHVRMEDLKYINDQMYPNGNTISEEAALITYLPDAIKPNGSWSLSLNAKSLPVVNSPHRISKISTDKDGNAISGEPVYEHLTCSLADNPEVNCNTSERLKARANAEAGKMGEDISKFGADMGKNFQKGLAGMGNFFKGLGKPKK